MVITPILIEAGITGFESPAAEYTQLSLSLDQLLIEHPQATFLGLANGDSMNQVGIYDGDILIVDRALTPRHMDVVVTTYNGNFSCKLFDQHRRLLLSASEQYPPIAIERLDSFLIEGVVSRSIRCHRTSQFSHVCTR
ncbi:LexA family transcriptional regulator [Psychrobium sp. 1_MG-2023]|uniref:LexA family protein n=1 Tax=Psychrobium sp. 1_MG-2023 TaxID=3062624 RepID=UPI000C3206EC|nr:translesion error-prone DNA polymerase V autoproteolytic subunit [Psychrobium sp. 1_MG-2023]MDP2561774.1 translesion error-prone DNA polymerase V autoproteolytic subunit [Psychrobium sp. 1_MG-2023]PKF59742.1 peptidase [Alteromonadales bacterium alter-6D02]